MRLSVKACAEELCACVSVRVAVQLSESSGFTLWEYLMTTRPGIGWVKGTASVTGVVLQVIICLMVLCSSTFVRRSGHFEVGFFTFEIGFVVLSVCWMNVSFIAFNFEHRVKNCERLSWRAAPPCVCEALLQT